MLSRFVFYLAEYQQKLNQHVLLFILSVITVFVIAISGTLLVSKINKIDTLHRHYTSIKRTNQHNKTQLVTVNPYSDRTLLSFNDKEQYLAKLHEWLNVWNIQQVSPPLVKLKVESNVIKNSAENHTLYLLASTERMIEFLLFINKAKPDVMINVMHWQASQHYLNKVLVKVEFVFNPNSEVN